MFHHETTGRSGCRSLVVPSQESIAASSKERKVLIEQNTPHSTFANNFTFQHSRSNNSSDSKWWYNLCACALWRGMVWVVSAVTAFSACMNIIINVIKLLINDRTQRSTQGAREDLVSQVVVTAWSCLHWGDLAFKIAFSRSYDRGYTLQPMY